MKRTAEIIDYLVRPDTPNTIYLAPGAPPVARSQNGLQVALPVVMDGGDVQDTIVSLRETGSPPGIGGSREAEKLPPSGSFNFSVPGRGRFRVHHATQRGTKVAAVAYIPYDIPALDTICTDPAIQALTVRIMKRKSGMLVITGPDPESNARLLYGMLREINQKERLIVCVMERALSFLISHGESVVIQTELGSDVQSFDDGLIDAYRFNPQLIAIGDLRPNDELPNLNHAVGAGMLVILTSVSMHGQALLDRYAHPGTGTLAKSADRIWEAVRVMPLNQGHIEVRNET